MQNKKNHEKKRANTSQRGPLPCSELHDFACLAVEPVRHLFDGLPVMLGAFEHAVDEVTMLQDRNQRLDGVQLRTAGWQPEQGDVGGGHQFPGLVPARAVEDDDGMLARGTCSPILR